MDELFTASQANAGRPLADRLRPRTLDEIVGQDHIVGKGRLLRRSIQADRLSSLLFYGPPGTGKTSLARVIANSTKAHFESLNAVLSGVKEVRQVISQAAERRRLYSRRTILFVDEVHRWNKAQQDALLPWVENGTVIFIGATTENPFFEVNKALVSRSRIFQLKSLLPDDLKAAIRRALNDPERGYGQYQVILEAAALDHLVEVANGDARSLLNAVELAVETSVDSWPPPPGTVINIDLQTAEDSIQRKAVLYDRDGDYHYDSISAFIKSLRGSDPDAALYWLAKMVTAGEDPAYIFRRMLISACEDVGLADPQAVVVVQACASAFERLGFPEGNFPLAEAALYLATAPKSNSSLAFFDALKEVERQAAEVPNHLRDANRDAQGFGHGDGYIYPHAYREHWAAQRYLPKALSGRTFYNPSICGYEGLLRQDILRKRELQLAVILEENHQTAENLSFTAAAGRDTWLRRLVSGRSSRLGADRDAIFTAADLARHHRVLILAADDGLLLWEAVRRTPEGLTAGLVRSDSAKAILAGYAASLDEVEQPQLASLANPAGGLPTSQQAEAWFTTGLFDRILARDPWTRTTGPAKQFFTTIVDAISQLLAPQAKIVLLLSPPANGQRLSQLIAREGYSQWPPLADLQRAEAAFFGDAEFCELTADELTWKGELLLKAFEDQGFDCTMVNRTSDDQRLISRPELAAWFDSKLSAWGAAMAATLKTEAFKQLHDIMLEIIQRGPLNWSYRSQLLTAQRRKTL